MKKRILSIVLAIFLVLSCVPITVFAANEDATELQNLLNGGGTVTLTKDYTIDTALNVTNTVTLDLNGYTINMTGSDSVIKLGSGGNLTLQDSNKTSTHTDSTLPAGGVITGGNAIFGGGVYVGSGSFTMSGGTIANCTADYGGGVEVDGGNFTMTGSANIQGCKAAKKGGGVHTMSGGGSMTMTGGAITNCSATEGGGVFNAITFTMSGGSIANCSSTVPYASGGGGGVFNIGNFTMSDGVIENCSAASSFGGGVFHENDFTMRGGTIRGCSAKYGGGVRVDFSTFTISGGTIEACTETVNGKSDAVNMSFDASLLVNGGTIKGMVTAGSNSTIKNTSADSCTVFYDAVKNYGTISGGVYYGGIQNISSGTVSGTYHTVSFDLNGGSGTAPILQWFFNTNTAKALQPDNPINDAYNTFAGWYNGDTKYEFTEAVTQSITLTAKYGDPKTYNISYDLDGGTASNPATYTVESDAITLTNPTRPGFTFTGWSGTDISGQDNMTVTIATGSTGDRTYTAHWRDLMKPVIAGIEDGKTYCDTVEFEVSDNVGVASVTANDVTLTPDANNKYTLEKGTGTVTVVAIDKANNQTSVTVTVNDGHT
ncbi:MAG: InlB B-repeat-containing protein, partial [Clostridiales bacterium]|nr:InlB B-repeat-containing protein [Clostridiales bacterium]